MKNLYIFPLLLLLNSCSSIDGVNPSQNSSLTHITQVSKSKKDGLMQTALDNWLKKEWTPIVEEDKKIKKENADDSRSFSLQEYVDKAVVYSKKNKTDIKDSHSDMIKSMPVIGY